MGVLRWEFRTMLVQIEDQVLRLGRRVEALVPRAVTALQDGNEAAAAGLVRADDQIDVEAADVADEIYRVLATQAPVAGDLRLVIGLMHVIRSVERIGDYCVNIARLTEPAEPADQTGADEALAAQLTELARQAEKAVGVGLDAFGRRLKDGVRRAAEIEQPLDTLREGLTRRLFEHAAASPEATGWSMRMMLACRNLERIGDHAMTIAEQGMFVATGRHRPPRSAR